MGAVEHLKTLCCLGLPPESAMIAVVLSNKHDLHDDKRYEREPRRRVGGEHQELIHHRLCFRGICARDTLSAMVHRTMVEFCRKITPYIKEWADRINITLFLEQIAVCLVSQPWRSKLLTNVKLWRAIQNQTKFCAQAVITLKRVKTGAHSPNVCDGYRRINSAENIVMHLGVK